MTAAVNPPARSAPRWAAASPPAARDRILGDCDRLGLRIITMRDVEYPDRLRNIYDPPLLLYVQGRMPRFDEEVPSSPSRRGKPAGCPP